MIKLVPIVRPANAHLFCKGENDQPFFVSDTVGGHEVTTGFLKFGVQFNLLGISQADHLIASGMIDTTDSIDEDNARLSEIALGDATGRVVQTLAIPKAFSNAVIKKDRVKSRRDLVVSFDSDFLQQHGYPLRLQIEGRICTQTGSTELQIAQAHIPDSELSVIGYRLDIQRINYNRMPVPR